jgi:membrane fusion protein (multidrug efflux system)
MPEDRVPRDRPDEYADAPESDRRVGRQPAPPTDLKQSQPRGQPGGGGAGVTTAPGPDTKRSKLPLIILGIVLVLAATGGGTYWWLTRDQESTDDAYTDGHAVTISPQVAGIVVKLAVTDNQLVHAGDLLLQIDPRDYQAARDQAAGALAVAEAQLTNAQEAYSKAQVQFPSDLQAAQAQVASAEANLTNAQADDRRQHAISRAATTQQTIDEASAKLREAEAQLRQARAQLLTAQLVTQNIAQAAAQVKQWQGQVEQARAELDRADLNLSYTRLLAPQDGWVTERRVEQGNYVQVGGALLTLVSPKVWITANFKETQLTRLRPGQQASIGIDAYPGLRLTGHVESVQMGSGSRFTAFPAENATGNYVKIVQRVPVKIAIDGGLDANTPLPLGLSATPTVTVK